MKREVSRAKDLELQKEYPIEGQASGWRFRVTETSNSVWLVEGRDAFGRSVSRQGTDLDDLMSTVEADARKITANLD